MTRHKHISTAALVVAMLALVASLGGGSYAAKLITGKDIKNGSITGKDIKKNSVKGKQIKDKSLTGADLKDGSIAPADLAAGTLEPAATTIRVAATSGATADAARTAAPERVLFTEGPLTVYAKCYTDTSAPQTYAVTYVKTAVNGAILASGTDYLGGGGAVSDALNTDTPEADRELERESAGTNSSSYWRSLAVVQAPDGTTVSGLVTVGAKNGTLAAGDAAYGAGDSCTFSQSLRGN